MLNSHCTLIIVDALEKSSRTRSRPDLPGLARLISSDLGLGEVRVSMSLAEWVGHHMDPPELHVILSYTYKYKTFYRDKQRVAKIALLKCGWCNER